VEEFAVVVAAVEAAFVERVVAMVGAVALVDADIEDAGLAYDAVAVLDAP
jgi:hypothetical protein